MCYLSITMPLTNIVNFTNCKLFGYRPKELPSSTTAPLGRCQVYHHMYGATARKNHIYNHIHCNQLHAKLNLLTWYVWTHLNLFMQLGTSLLSHHVDIGGSTCDQTLPFCDLYEVDFGSLSIEHELGQGAFGRVMKATLSCAPEGLKGTIVPITVAAKMLKGESNVMPWSMWPSN